MKLNLPFQHFCSTKTRGKAEVVINLLLSKRKQVFASRSIPRLELEEVLL